MSEFVEFIEKYAILNDDITDNLNEQKDYELFITKEKEIKQKMSDLFCSFNFVFEYSTRKRSVMSIQDIIMTTSNADIDAKLLTNINNAATYDYDVSDLIVDDFNICQKCNVKLKYDNMLKIHNCPMCGATFTSNEIEHDQFYPEQNNVSNLNDTVQNIHSPSEHNRIKHFVSYLEKMMGVEVVTIPTKILDVINEEMLSDGISPNDIFFNYNLLKKYLRRRKLNKWIPNIPKIYKKYTGNNLVPQLTTIEKNQIITMYKDIQGYIIRYLQENKRKNFPTCWYFIRKIVEHLEIPLDVDVFHKIKLDKNTRDLDMIWKYICDKSNIIYIPTI